MPPAIEVLARSIDESVVNASDCSEDSLHVSGRTIRPRPIEGAWSGLHFRDDYVRKDSTGGNPWIVGHRFSQILRAMGEAHSEQVSVGALIATPVGVDNEVLGCQKPVQAEIPVSQALRVSAR